MGRSSCGGDGPNWAPQRALTEREREREKKSEREKGRERGSSSSNSGSGSTRLWWVRKTNCQWEGRCWAECSLSPLLRRGEEHRASGVYWGPPQIPIPSSAPHCTRGLLSATAPCLTLPLFLCVISALFFSLFLSPSYLMCELYLCSLSPSPF